MVNPANSDQIVTYGKGHVIFLNLQKDKRVLKKNGVFGTVEKPKIVTCAEFTPNGDLLTGDSNGTIIGWKNGSNHSSFCITNVHQGKHSIKNVNRLSFRPYLLRPYLRVTP